MKGDPKTIGVKVYFFTNGLPEKVGSENDKTPFWTRGAVYLEVNKTKGTKTQQVMFNHFDDIPNAIRTVLRKGKLVAVEHISSDTTKNKRRKK